MCEFTVYLVEEGQEKKVVAKNIVIARRRDGKMLLIDVMGAVTPVENVNIEETNTLSQEMVLKRG
ncbi:MAG TPA: CooT family nickel-binding protein [Methanotrichaceae archaeon]|nr:CooT family nickel-binding protein [Methanotrichaceae archaeon]HQF17342.1 CooT family nickel-binding protein [Methanotrichaceae archaeon]HQI91958.1 CooT family nickel-binding protein [Methanotrichaceae archaeon]